MKESGLLIGSTAFLYTVQTLLLRNGMTHSGPGPSTSINNKEKCLKTNLMGVISADVPSFQVTLIHVKLSEIK